MSDTPRTDAHSWHDGDYDDPLHALSDFARKLERELNSANQIIRQQQLLEEENLRLTAKVAQLYEGAEEQKQTIKRLKNAGDGLSMWVCPEYKSDPANIALIEWRKAKEAKL